MTVFMPACPHSHLNRLNRRTYFDQIYTKHLFGSTFMGARSYFEKV